MNAHAASGLITAFAASLVEFIEALTVVLAVGAATGWRNALAGAAAGLAVLAGLLAAVGPVAAVPGAPLRLLAGILSLLFGLRWLRKAVLRAAGLLPLHDEATAYAQARARLRETAGRSWSAGALLTAFQVVLVEGIEVVFIVAATAAGGGFIPAATGAAAALALVFLLGVLLHRPITRVPENKLKFAVGVMMAAFGTFWTAESIGAPFPGGDAALPCLAAIWLAWALLMVRMAARGGVPVGVPASVKVGAP